MSRDGLGYGGSLALGAAFVVAALVAGAFRLRIGAKGLSKWMHMDSIPMTAGDTGGSYKPVSELTRRSRTRGSLRHFCHDIRTVMTRNLIALRRADTP